MIERCGPRWLCRNCWIGLIVLVCVFVRSNSANAGVPADFGQDIRPILSDKCFACHGPDSNKRTGGFRLDVKESAFGAADSGARPIVPGNIAESELIARITATDPDLRMPPADSTKTLDAVEIKRIEEWIAGGAKWDEHWAFVPPRKPSLPVVQNKDWPANPIDHFILARLEQEGLAPSPEADKTTLIRRVTLDLTGLPPTPVEVDRFLSDSAPDAYAKLVDRLLKSSRYGEHMSRFWLDAARFGDTHGLHLDNYREMWPYRDWVVNAFNRNLPYNQFVIEQLAGDLLPGPTLDQLVATGFNRCHVSTNEGGSIEEEVYVRNIVDRVATTGVVFMGLTFDCTRCHDHKFDPLTMRDFYSMFGFFNSIDGSPLDGNREDPAPVVKVPSEQQTSSLNRYSQEIAHLEFTLGEPWVELDSQQTEWENSLVALKTVEADDTDNKETAEKESAHDPKENLLSMSDWYFVGPFSENVRYLKSKKHGPEGKVVNLADLFKLETGQMVGWIKRPDWVDAKPHTNLPGDVAANFLFRTITSPTQQTVAVSLGSDDGIKVYLNNKQILYKDVERSVAADQETIDLKLRKGDNQLVLKILNYGGASGFYFEVKSNQVMMPENILASARLPVADRSAEQRLALREFYRNKVATYAPLKVLQNELAELRGKHAAIEREIPTTMVFRELPEPKPAFLLTRGEYDQPGEQVNRATPGFLPPMPSGLPMNRLGLAQWLVSEDHPLTARVAVNRLWYQVFGTGIVETAEDFGSQGTPPSHPKLLDWLAVTFRENDWDMKELMRQFVLSSTYKQSAHVTSDLYRRDRKNRLLARGPRFRLDAETLRDQALFVSGLLVEEMGGPSVKPPQPAGLWSAVGYSGSNTVRFVADSGPNKVHRRTLYTFIKRTSPPPQMSTFDGPSREACTIRRERTNTPMQALLLFNDPQFLEPAKALALRAVRQGGDSVTAKATQLFRACLCRNPTEIELAELTAGFEQDLLTYSGDIEAARKLLSIGSEIVVPLNDEETAELAAWTMTANMLLNLDEVVNKN